MISQDIEEWQKASSIYQTRYRQKKRLNLILEHGDICYLCLKVKGFNRKLEFHHLKPTGLNGEGRGFDNRIRDIVKHPDSYILLCRKCHEKAHGFKGDRPKDLVIKWHSTDHYLMY